jgi:hypothetical protein
MSDFRFDYQSVRSLETGLFIYRPIITVTLKTLADATSKAIHGRFRVDSGADYSAVPLEFASTVLGLRGKPTHDEIVLNLVAAMRAQNLKPVRLATASGDRRSAYPLWVPVEISDDDGFTAEFEGLMAFVEGKKSGFLAGLCGFLDKFDVSFRTQEFEFDIRAGSGVA